MSESALMWVGMATLALTTLLGYQYLVSREAGKCQIKKFLVPKFDFYSLLVMLVAFFAAAYIFLRGFLLQADGSFMRAMMNALVMLWLAILGYIDAREKIIPNSMILLGLGFWAVLMLMELFLAGTPWKQLLQFSGLGGAVCGGVLLLIATLVKSALGMGDVKMFFVLGLLYGLMDTYGILLFSIIVMGVISVILLIAKKVTTKTAIPMAPFVVIGFFLSILAGM